jgi:hypothetical protein
MKRLAILVALALTAAAGPHKVVRKSTSLDFNYEWPAEAAAIPSLDLRLYNEAKHDLARAQKEATSDKQIYEQQQRGSVRDSYYKKWTTAGETRRLLSLQFQHSTYTGGAHPNSDVGALLWDRELSRPIAVTALFLRRAALEALTRAAYCKGLDHERHKRRGNFTPELPEFNACPSFSDLAISPSDENGNGRFDTFKFVASPYVAGPYAEGLYDIEVQVTPQLIAAMKPAYRNSFEAQRQRSGAGAG